MDSQRDERRERGADEQSGAPAAPAIRGIALFCNQVALTARRGQERGAVCDKRNSMAEYAFFEPIDPEELACFLVSAWCRFSCPEQAKIRHSRENCPRSKQLSPKMLTRKSFTGNHLRPEAARIPPSPPRRSKNALSQSLADGLLLMVSVTTRKSAPEDSTRGSFASAFAPSRKSASAPAAGSSSLFPARATVGSGTRVPPSI